MHSNAKSHDSHFGVNWSLANVSIALLLMLFFLIFLLLLMTITAPPAYGQQSVPPTARQAATMPQFAAKLAHNGLSTPASHLQSPPSPRASYKNPRARFLNGGPLDDNTLYTNGPINGTTDAWTLNFGFVTSDSFTVGSNSGSVNGLVFGAWPFPGDVLQTVEISITSSEFGGTTYFDQVVSFTQSGCSGNQYGFNVCTETSANFSGPNLAAGTYWLNLDNAVVNDGDPVYWDENSGPSMASENAVGTIPSEAFTILGSTTTTCDPYCPPPPPPCFEPGEGVQVIHDFTAQEASGTGSIIVQSTEILYGVTPAGGDNGLGLVYKLFQQGQNWTFKHLYDFTGGEQGAQPYGLVIGPDGALYGTAAGGIGSGVAYKLRPRPNACGAISCGWDETVLYEFTGVPDGAGPTGNLGFDKAGDLYGTTSGGGAYGAGTVFELTPSNGGWTEKVLYSFTEGGPSSLLLGGDGNLYGLAAGGDPCWEGERCGIVFQLVPSHNGWTENVLYSFENTQDDGLFPAHLVQDSAGNLYGTSTWFRYDDPSNTAAILFELSPSNGNWTFTSTLVTQGNDYFDSFHSLAIDHAGNLYSAETSIARYPLWCAAGHHSCYWTAGGHGFGVSFLNQQFNAYALAPDAQGQNLYGLTPDCGAYGRGTVWQIGP